MNGRTASEKRRGWKAAALGVIAAGVWWSTGCGPGGGGATEPAAPSGADGSAGGSTETASPPASPAPDVMSEASPSAAADSSGPGPHVWFEDVRSSSGVDFVHVSGHDGKHFIPEIVAGGAALLDYDGDGDLDLYLVQGGGVRVDAADRPGNRLYRNDGDFRFTDVTEASGAGDRGYGMGVACGDYDNDGRTDLYVTNVGPNVLYRNNGDGTFTDVTLDAGVGDPGFGASATFLDYDGDGDLDLMAVNYLNWSVATELVCYNDMGEADYCAPGNYQAPARDVLYRNNGDGTFTDVTVELGLAAKFGTGLGVAAADFDGDGRVEIAVANDGMEDQFWVWNARAGVFADLALMKGTARDQDGQAKAGMGMAVNDVDFDGDPDLLVCNLGNETDSFFRNDGAFFTDVTAAKGLAPSRPFTRFGIGWHDFDNDGALDLYQANGRVMTKSTRYTDDDVYAEPNLLFVGGADGRFAAASPRGGVGGEIARTSRAAAFGDLDDDGGVDIVVVNRNAPPSILRNRVPERGGWVMARLVDGSGRDALNARLTARAGDRLIVREARSGSSYLASNDPRIHVGLGGAAGLTGIEVRWPSGRVERFDDVLAGSIVTLREGAGIPR